MKNYFPLIIFLLTDISASAQIGSLRDPDFVGLNNRLISLEFNGRIYAPRHGRLSTKEYKNKIMNSSGQVIMEANTRPVELFVSEDGGKSWIIACINPLYVSTNVSILTSQLLIHVESALMKKINENYFILATEYSFHISDSPKVKYFTIIFLLKEDIKPDHYPVYIESVFISDQIENNKVIDVSTMGSVTTFKFEQKGSATLTFNPDAEYEWMYRDSFGGFHGRGKSN